MWKEMPDGSLFKVPYPIPPSPDDEAILIPIRNARPEDIPGLAWSKPDFSADGHRIIRTFSIDIKKRPGREYIRCAICSGDHPKFLDGAVLWSPDCYLRLIGHVCAAKPEHFGEAGYRTLRRLRDQEELDKAAFDWLQTYGELAKSFSALITEVHTCARHLEEQQRVFFRDVKPLADALTQRARYYDGTLTVSEKLSAARIAASASGAMQSLYEDMVIGTMTGTEFLHRPKKARSKELEGNLQALNLIPDGQGEESMLALIDQGGEQAITVTAGAVFRALGRALTVAEQCRESKGFISSNNIAALTTWGVDTRNPMQFAIQQRRAVIEFTLPDRSRAALKTEWPPLPDLASLAEVVSGGIQLGKLLERQAGRTN